MMTSWAKNQIAKQLARFVKNLDPSQISLKFLKGEGELLNIELNEQVLTDLLELPPWLQLRKAICNRICAKIRWTSLKTDPIRLFLDCVEVEIYASENITPVAKQASPQQPRYASKEKQQLPKASKYGFAEKVVDGMFVSINSVMVAFKAPGFKASFSMSRFTVQSTDQCWVVPSNLRKTRVKDEQRGQVLIFKEIKWGTMRLDADAAYVEASEHGSIPIRLITNNSAIHLTIKKSLNDCSLVSSRLEVILDDILWILTQSQLLKLSSFVHYILRIRQKFLPMASHSAIPKDHRPAAGGQSAHNTPRLSQYQGQGHGSTLSKLFTEYDIVETSYHVKTNQIDLHLCDDQTLSGKTAKQEKGKDSSTDQSGALLISIHRIRLDHYPYHIAGLKRKLERSDDDALFCRRQWAQQLFDFFLKNEGKRIRQTTQSLSKTTVAYQRPMMYESFFLISCSKFSIMQVTTNDRQEPQAFLSSDKESLFLPDDMDSFLFDFTSYYFIGYRNLPVPPSNMFLKMNPIKLIFHSLTCIWLNKFIQSVIAGFEWTKEFMAKEIGPPEHLDIRIECLMPQCRGQQQMFPVCCFQCAVDAIFTTAGDHHRQFGALETILKVLNKVSVPCEPDSTLPHQEERPKALQIQISQAIISNSRIGTATSQSDLLMDVQNANASKVYVKNSEFPNAASDCGPLPNDYWVNDYSIIYNRFLSAYYKDGACAVDKSQPDGEIQAGRPRTFSTLHSKEDPIPRVIWCLWCEQLWIDFVGIKKSFGRPVTLVDAVPVRLWLSIPVIIDNSLGTNSSNESTASYANEALVVNGSIPNGEVTDATGETVKRSLIKTDSATSLPLSFHSPAGVPSLSNASSSSSISTGSTVSSHDSTLAINHSEENCSKAADKLSMGQTVNRKTTKEFNQSPLRTSYSETDLIPHAKFEANLEQSSLQNVRGGAETIVNDTGPPPPYCISQSSDTRTEQNLDGKIEFMPPMYSQLPSYQSALETDNDSEAPPLPEKVPTDIKEYFVGNGENKVEDGSFNAGAAKMPVIGSILQVTKTASIQLDHFQLIFLLRLQEMFSDVASSIAADTTQFQLSQSPAHRQKLEATSFSLHISLPSIDINIILPQTEEVGEEQCLPLLDRISSGKFTRFVELVQPNIQLKENFDEDEVVKCKEDQPKVENMCSAPSDDDSGAVSQSETSCSLSDKSNCNSPSKASNGINVPILTGDIFTEDAKGNEFEKQEVDKMECEVKQSLSGVVLSTDLVEEMGPRSSVCNDTNEDSRSIAKFDVPSNPADHVMIADDSEGERDLEEVEICDKTSRFLDACESESNLRDALRLVETTEMGTQTENEVPHDSGYETYRDEAVSVVCLKCRNARVALYSEKEDMILKIVIEEVKLKEEGNITYGMTLDHRLSTDVNKEKEEPIVSESAPQVMVRLLSGPAAKEFGEDAVQLGFADVKVKSLRTQLHLSNAESLSEFVEDEYLIKRMPFKVELDDLQIKLLDNKARRYLSALLPPPLEIKILKLFVRGESDGKIALDNSFFKALDSTVGLTKNLELSADKNECYETGLLCTGGKASESRQENKEMKIENERLVDDLKLANARLISLEQERDAILKVVDKLQQELMWSNHENEKLSSKLNDYKIYLKNLNRR